MTATGFSFGMKSMTQAKAPEPILSNEFDMGFIGTEFLDINQPKPMIKKPPTRLKVGGPPKVNKTKDLDFITFV